MNILVTGGAGYIGSHTLIELSKTGHHIEDAWRDAWRWQSQNPNGFGT